MTQDGVSVIVAVHNESENIGLVLADIKKEFHLNNILNFEIFVSEDGSTDSTREVVNNLSNTCKEIRLSETSSRLGYSKALNRGILESRYPLLSFIDGDGQTKAQDLVRLINAYQKDFVIIGYRNPRSDSKSRRVQSKMFYLLYRLLRFPKMIDVSSGSIVIARDQMLDFASREIKLKYGYWWEFQAWRNANGIRVLELPVKHYPRRAGKTQVYKISKLGSLAISHFVGLLKLYLELKLK